ncbi:MAG: AbrB/MazE/SpoVT family DNA-binding domain-containing protein [Caulobacter sp.]
MSGFKEDGRPFRSAEPEARAKLFTHGGSQAVRLPKAFRFEGAEVSIRREGDQVILEPVRPRSVPRSDEEWAAFWARLDAMADGDVLEAPPDPPCDDKGLEW